MTFHTASYEECYTLTCSHAWKSAVIQRKLQTLVNGQAGHLLVFMPRAVRLPNEYRRKRGEEAAPRKISGKRQARVPWNRKVIVAATLASC